MGACLGRFWRSSADSGNRRRQRPSLFLLSLFLFISLFLSSLPPALPGARARRRVLPGAARALACGAVGGPRGGGRARRPAAAAAVVVVRRRVVPSSSCGLHEPPARDAAPVDQLHHRAAPLRAADAAAAAPAVVAPAPGEELAVVVVEVSPSCFDGFFFFGFFRPGRGCVSALLLLLSTDRW